MQKIPSDSSSFSTTYRAVNEGSQNQSPLHIRLESNTLALAQ